MRVTCPSRVRCISTPSDGWGVQASCARKAEGRRQKAEVSTKPRTSPRKLEGRKRAAGERMLVLARLHFCLLLSAFCPKDFCLLPSAFCSKTSKARTNAPRNRKFTL